MEINLLAKMNRSYSLLLKGGFYQYIAGGDLLNDEIKEGNLYKLKAAFRYNSKDFSFDLFLSGGIKTISSELNKVENLNLRAGISLKF